MCRFTDSQPDICGPAEDFECYFHVGIGNSGIPLNFLGFDSGLSQMTIQKDAGSALMKLFLDRLGYACHRPQFQCKAFSSVVVQGFFGGDKIFKYFDLMGAAIGFDVVNGSCSTALVPMTEQERKQRDRTLARQAQRFREQLMQTQPHVPSLIEIVLFRFGRNNVRIELGENDRDYQYYSERGWFNSDYFYPIRLGLIKRLIGHMADAYFARSITGKG
jgi:hypothetical protein